MEISNGLTLHGVVTITRENIETGEKIEWCKKHNTITLSGAQWIMMKMFGLYLDSKHSPRDTARYEVLTKDTTLAVPDLNARSSLPIGKQVNTYTIMNDDISANHICQGFMVGNGGGAEDGITAKNTDYSFATLRRPIPFQQTNQESLDADIAGKYLGIAHMSDTSTSEPFAKSFYIKKFDERPHIYHSWWRDNQRWDYIDPVTVADLGPNPSVPAKTNRIESYVECKLSLSDDDCFSWFEHAGNTETAAINELGLVAFDVDAGARSVIEACYNNYITEFLNLLYDNNRSENAIAEILRFNEEILHILTNIELDSRIVNIKDFGDPNINEFVDTLIELSGETEESMTPEKIIYYQEAFAADTNIKVSALYDQKGVYVYESDLFLHELSMSYFDSLTTDEAQRIKLVTYYTFNSIPLQKNWRTLINYRIYAN